MIWILPLSISILKTVILITKKKRLRKYYGAWNRAENSAGLEWFLKNVYPKLPASADFQFAVIGGGMDERLKSKISVCKNFKILGFVENPVVEIAKCQALVALLFKGAGVKSKSHRRSFFWNSRNRNGSCF